MVLGLSNLFIHPSEHSLEPLILFTLLLHESSRTSSKGGLDDDDEGTKLFLGGGGFSTLSLL